MNRYIEYGYHKLNCASATCTITKGCFSSLINRIEKELNDQVIDKEG